MTQAWELAVRRLATKLAADAHLDLAKALATQFPVLLPGRLSASTCGLIVLARQGLGGDAKAWGTRLSVHLWGDVSAHDSRPPEIDRDATATEHFKNLSLTKRLLRNDDSIEQLKSKIHEGGTLSPSEENLRDWLHFGTARAIDAVMLPLLGAPMVAAYLPARDEPLPCLDRDWLASVEIALLPLYFRTLIRATKIAIESTTDKTYRDLSDDEFVVAFVIAALGCFTPSSIIATGSVRLELGCTLAGSWAPTKVEALNVRPTGRGFDVLAYYSQVPDARVPTRALLAQVIGMLDDSAALLLAHRRSSRLQWSGYKLLTEIPSVLDKLRQLRLEFAPSLRLFRREQLRKLYEWTLGQRGETYAHVFGQGSRCSSPKHALLNQRGDREFATLCAKERAKALSCWLDEQSPPDELNGWPPLGDYLFCLFGSTMGANRLLLGEWPTDPSSLGEYAVGSRRDQYTWEIEVPCKSQDEETVVVLSASVEASFEGGAWDRCPCTVVIASLFLLATLQRKATNRIYAMDKVFAHFSCAEVAGTLVFSVFVSRSERRAPLEQGRPDNLLTDDARPDKTAYWFKFLADQFDDAEFVSQDAEFDIRLKVRLV